MLAAEATTWGEISATFGSLCHAWSATPNSDLSGYVLGVRPTEPGLCGVAQGSGFGLNVTVPMKAVVELSVPARSLETTRLSSEVRPQMQVFTDGRARF